MAKEKRLLLVYSFGHTCVDLLGGFLLYRKVFTTDNYLFLWIVVYHGLAFCLEPVVGYFTDKYKKINFGIIGMALVVLGYFVASLSRFTGTFMAGLGNAMFHIAGGYISLHQSDKKLWEPAFFVSTGAIGVTLGKLFGNNTVSDLLICLIFGILPLILLVINKVPSDLRDRDGYFGITREENKDLSLILVIVSLCIRGYIGFTFSFSWDYKYKIIFLTAMVVLGKILGGVLSDRFGSYKVAIISSVVSAVCFILADVHFLFGLSALLCTNMVMVHSLVCVSDLLPDKTGLAFGIIPFGLYAGFLLSMVLNITGISYKVVVVILSLSVAYIYKTVLKEKNYDKD